MGSTLETVVFYFLAAFIIAMSIMTVTTQRIVRSGQGGRQIYLQDAPVQGDC